MRRITALETFHGSFKRLSIRADQPECDVTFPQDAARKEKVTAERLHIQKQNK